MVFQTSSWRHTELRCEAVAVPGLGAWGRASFFAFSPSAAVLTRIYYADYPLGTGMDMDVSNFNRLLVTTPVPVDRLDQLELEPEQSSSIPAVDADERFIQMPLAVLKELEADESRGHDLNSDERFEFALRLNGGDQRDRGVESCLLKHVKWPWPQCRDELRQHDVNELVGKRFPEDTPESGLVLFQLCRRRHHYIAVPAGFFESRRSFFCKLVR
jgi:hypothetical protein